MEKETLKVESDELDIYAVVELKEKIERLFGEGVTDLTLDLSSVESISTPALQLIISCGKLFKNFEITKFQPSVEKQAEYFGIAS